MRNIKGKMRSIKSKISKSLLIVALSLPLMAPDEFCPQPPSEPEKECFNYKQHEIFENGQVYWLQLLEYQSDFVGPITREDVLISTPWGMQWKVSVERVLGTASEASGPYGLPRVGFKWNTKEFPGTVEKYATDYKSVCLIETPHGSSNPYGVN